MKSNRVVFAREDFGDKLWEKVGQQVSLLLDSGYEVFIHYDEPAFGIVVIEFCPDSRLKVEWGSDRFILVSADEEEDILSRRNFDLENSN